MNNNLTHQIFKKEIKEYVIQRLDSLSTTDDGKQIKNKTSHNVKLAIYKKGSRVVRKEKEDSYTTSIIHIYSETDSLSLLDEIELDGYTYIVLEKKDFGYYSFYKASANV